ncbi:hypothetical protein NBRGN_063_00360 [Nocardia brasiliensis NBRC 14402]|nr:hypothetical protein NBRGN_063_00360 [Nocardia brasiliensis NBRC 14402]
MKMGTVGRTKKVVAHTCLALTAGLTLAVCPALGAAAHADPVPVAPPLPFPSPGPAVLGSGLLQPGSGQGGRGPAR